MTVKELRKELDRYSDDTLVVMSGYESGFSDIRHVESDMLHDYDGLLPSYEGRFQEIINRTEMSSCVSHVYVVTISR